MSKELIIGKVLEIYTAVRSFTESNLVWFQLVSVLLSGLFLWGIIYIITKTKYFDIKAEKYMDILGKGNITRRRSLKGWEQIRKRIISPNQQDWKIAVLEADKIFNETLKMSGYLGSDLTKKLETLNTGNLANLEEAKEAHSVADKIMKDPSMELSKKNAIVVLKLYKKIFIELNLLEE